ncbi:MAG: hypothetical protein IT317_04245 [Anaerolineales bacterium]|nr:hypothetical protein [Anaerolineales bacterium]
MLERRLKNVVFGVMVFIIPWGVGTILTNASIIFWFDFGCAMFVSLSVAVVGAVLFEDQWPTLVSSALAGLTFPLVTVLVILELILPKPDPVLIADGIGYYISAVLTQVGSSLAAGIGTLIIWRIVQALALRRRKVQPPAQSGG